MQQHLTEQTVVYSAKNDTEKIFDYILPEYLPGIARIVKTYASIEKCVFSANIGEAASHITLKISIVYISEYDGKIKSATFREEIPVSFKEPFEYTGEYIATPSCFVSSAHATPQSPRKLSVKLTLQASVTAYSENKTPLFYPQEDSEICVLKDTVTAYRKKLFPEAHFEQNEEISIDNGKAGIGEIIHSDASFIGTDVSASDGELNFNANINLRILYESSSDEDEKEVSYAYLDTALTLSDILHCDDITQDDIPFIYIDIYSVEPSVSLDPYGENRVISLSIKYSVSGFTYEKQNLEFITDAFMQGCADNPDFANANVDTIQSHLSKKELISQAVHADIREITEISACNAKIQSVSIEHSEGQFFATARCLTEILGTNISGELSATDVPVLLRIPLGGKEFTASDTIPEVIINISSCSAQIKDGGLKLDFEVTINGVFVVHSQHRLVCSLVPSPDSVHCKKNGEIIIYYPSKEERLWEIAKKYRVSPEKICCVNGEDEKSIQNRRTVIIP